jgi:preprotein translocase subunit SecA
MFEAMMKGVALDFVRYAMQVQVNVQVQGGGGGPAAVGAPVPDGPPSEPTADAAPTPEPLPVAEPALFAAQPEPLLQGISYSAPDDSAAGGGLSSAVAATAVADGPAAPAQPEVPAANVPVVKSDWDKTPRNAPCPCGSGKKFKLCHGA